MVGAEDEVVERPPSLLRCSWFIVRAMGSHKLVLLATLVAAAAVAVSDIVSLSLILPFVAIVSGQGAVAPELPLSFLLPSFEGLSVAGQLRAVAVGLVLVTLVRSVFSYAESRTSAMMTVLIERDLRQRVFDEIMATDVGHVQRQRTSDLLIMMQNYPRQAAAIADIYLASLSKVMLLVGLTWTMLAISPQLTLVAIGLGIITTALITGVRLAIRRVARAINTERVVLQQIGIETLQGIKVIHAFGREAHVRDRFLTAVRRLQMQSYKRASLSALAPQLQRIIGMALVASIIIGATFILSDLTVFALSLMFFLIVIMRMLGPISALAKQQSKIYADLPAVEEIMGFLAAPKPKMKDGHIEPGPLAREIRFEGVDYAYADGAQVLHDVSFTIPRGKTVALVGASGSGKSTIAQLVARLADPTRGRVLVDGVDLRELRVGGWRRRIAIVSQDGAFFHMSVRENIRFGRLDATDAEVEEAAKLAGAHEFITQLEQGYETVIGDRGTRLSGGQAQRVAIARALLADPDLLILDEATSALDAETERAVQTAIERVSRDRTVLAIAHRLATVRDADEILVLEAGRIVERGTHDDLLALQGRYAGYVGMQDVNATPPRRVPVQEEAAPPRAAPAMRLVVDAARRVGVLVHEGGARREVALREANGHVPAGDVAVLTAGSGEALVQVDGEQHAGIPVFGLREDGSEYRSRVMGFRKPARGVTRLVRRFFP